MAPAPPPPALLSPHGVPTCPESSVFDPPRRDPPVLGVPRSPSDVRGSAPLAPPPKTRLPPLVIGVRSPAPKNDPRRSSPCEPGV